MQEQQFLCQIPEDLCGGDGGGVGGGGFVVNMPALLLYCILVEQCAII